MHVPDTKHIQIVAPDDVPLPQSINPTSK
jgi:hypothetical protein